MDWEEYAEHLASLWEAPAALLPDPAPTIPGRAPVPGDGPGPRDAGAAPRRGRPGMDPADQAPAPAEPALRGRS